MAVISRPHKLLFILSPRTASTAVAELLSNELDACFLPEADILDAGGMMQVQRKHSTIAQLCEHGLLNPSELPEFVKFTCVRNPYDSLVSFYLKKKLKYQPLLNDRDSWIYRVPGYVDDMNFCREHSFEEWILRKYHRPLWQRVVRRRKRSMSSRYTAGVDIVMRYEHLQEDFDRVLQRAGIDRPLVIPRVNSTSEKAGHYRDYYTPRARAVVERVFGFELEQHGYLF